MPRRLLVLIGLAVLLVILEGCSRDVPTRPLSESPGDSLQSPAPNAARLDLPQFDSRDFVAAVTNPYFPLRPGTVFNYAGTSDGEAETEVMTVTGQTKRILGVTTTVVWDRVEINGELAEETFDWYAQDHEGNVWYFGEDSKEYEDGRVVSTEGSWQAGKNGARPGIIMKADPRVGDTYAQEVAPGVAEDMARISALNRKVSVTAGDYTNCLATLEWTPLEPDVQEVKYYAPNVGMVLALVKKGGEGRLELISVSPPATRASR